MWLVIERERTSTLSDPAMVVAMSTSTPQYRAMYSQARELGEYMLQNMQFRRAATIYCSAFPPEVIVRDGGISTLPQCHIDLSREGGRDILLLTGDTSPMDAQYEFAETVLGYAVELGVRELYSIGARWAENPIPPEADPEPNGFSTDGVGVAKLRKSGVKVLTEEPAPFFASMVVGMAGRRGIRGFKLSVDHGEPSPHTKSVARLLGVLSSMAGFEVRVNGKKLNEEPEQKPPQSERETNDNSIYR